MAFKLLEIMHHVCFLQVFFILVEVSIERNIIDSYNQRREALFNRDKIGQLGSSIILESREKIVNAKLMEMKSKEMMGYVSGSGIFPPAHLFPLVKEKIEQSPIYQFIKKIPKGSLLHIHDFAMTSVQWLVTFATYLPHCYLCRSRRTNAYQFKFSATQPVSTQDCSWKLVTDERTNFKAGISKFDNSLVESIMFNTSEILSSRRNATRIWNFFEQYFSSVSGLILYSSVFPLYVYQGLKELHEDNIHHFEIRASLKKIYYLSGTQSSARTVFQKYIEGIRLFQKKHCPFCTVRIIISTHRSLPDTEIRLKLFEASELHRMYPGWIAGFDLVGQEDSGQTLFKIVPQFKGFNLPFFFHAGETNWQGVSTDENLFDAILLKTKRIGHGLAITKHPVLLEMVKERNIPIEVSPISNQVLGYVSDLRNHPASVLIAKNVSIVVNSDDPATWGSSGLSHDFYALFMGIASMHDDLRLLKKLALDSIRFSSLTKFQKQKLLRIWTAKWRLFIENEASSIEATKVY